MIITYNVSTFVNVLDTKKFKIIVWLSSKKVWRTQRGVSCHRRLPFYINIIIHRFKLTI